MTHREYAMRTFSSSGRRPVGKLAAMVVLGVLSVVGLLAVTPAATAQANQLPSWNDGPAKSAIIAFVEKVTAEGGADYVPPEERIAVFDNDGTLWAEQPMYFQLAFAMDEVRRLAPQHPEWGTTEPFRSILGGDIAAVAASGQKGIAEIIAATHAGMTTDEFSRRASDWLATATHPEKGRLYDELIYQPQLELLAYLRAEGFKTFIVSGGGVEFLRVFAERVYGIPPEQVIGSSGVVTFRLGADGTPELFKEAKIEFVDDGPGKPVAINRFIGRKPILAFGNSDGDQQMLEYVASGDRPGLAAVLQHTDASREWAYDRDSRVGKLDTLLDEALAKGWLVVDMATDWATVFPPGQ